jgi:cyclophilin family peptidyl-prolyl cis-trans isomerase
MALLVITAWGFSTALLHAGEGAAGKAPKAVIKTKFGDMEIVFFPDKAPNHVQNFIKLAKSGFYNGTIFHRVVAGFVAQAGGYTENFEQKPTTKAVFNESGNGLSNLRGTVGFARATEPHSGTSQFYINLADNVDLNPRPTRWGYAVFGKVVEGMEVVDDIGHRPTGAGGPFDRNVPVEPIVIETVQILP